jgi:hypothetical protein
MAGFMPTGQYYPSNGDTLANVRQTFSFEVINAGIITAGAPIKLSTQSLPPPPATQMIYSADPSVLWGSDGFQSGGFEYTVFTP